uniref:Succinate dehydrogenase assembly factor 3 n=1 Tax=Clastoptera arizonana TaxID=38151 RepID=A0A1B6CLA6_9HEMI
MTSLQHVQRIRLLYKVILRLHRGLPKALQSLGDNYVRDEFKRHKNCNLAEAQQFMVEWTNYAVMMSEQIGLKGPKTSAPIFGTHLSEELLDKMRDDQIQQLFELLKAANEKEGTS